MIILPREDLALLDGPDPVSQRAVQDKVRDKSREREMLVLVPSKFVVEPESDAGDDDGSVSER